MIAPSLVAFLWFAVFGGLPYATRVSAARSSASAQNGLARSLFAFLQGYLLYTSRWLVAIFFSVVE